MSEYAIVAPEDFDQSVFRLIGKEWMLVTAKNQEGKVNTMTASWGGLGVMWAVTIPITDISPLEHLTAQIQGIFFLSVVEPSQT